MNDILHWAILHGAYVVISVLVTGLFIWNRSGAKEGDSREIDAYLQRYGRRLIEARMHWFNFFWLGQTSSMMRVYTVVAEDAKGGRSERIIGIDPLAPILGHARLKRWGDFGWQDPF